MPVHRSLLLWLGVLVLLFTGWAWRDSLAMESIANWDGERLVQVRHAESAVTIYFGEGAYSGFAHFRNELGLEERLSPLFPKPEYQHLPMGEDEASNHLSIPHWLVMAVEVVAIVGWIAWLRWRRVGRKGARNSAS